MVLASMVSVSLNLIATGNGLRLPMVSEIGDRILKQKTRLLLTGLLFFFSAVFALPGTQVSGNTEASRWKEQARNVTIIRDDWGIAHVYGKTDADAVFGMIYAQAEDDFNRVETNYLNAMGRLAEAEGESKIYQDLRMKLFIECGQSGLAEEADECVC